MAEEKLQRFDEAIAQLEIIVRQLESGDLALEEALTAFEGGIALVRTLSERLCAAETQIEVLTRSANGSLQLEPLAGRDGDD